MDVLLIVLVFHFILALTSSVPIFSSPYETVLDKIAQFAFAVAVPFLGPLLTWLIFFSSRDVFPAQVEPAFVEIQRQQA